MRNWIQNAVECFSILVKKCVQHKWIYSVHLLSLGESVMCSRWACVYFYSEEPSANTTFHSENDLIMYPKFDLKKQKTYFPFESLARALCVCVCVCAVSLDGVLFFYSILPFLIFCSVFSHLPHQIVSPFSRCFCLYYAPSHRSIHRIVWHFPACEMLDLIAQCVFCSHFCNINKWFVSTLDISITRQGCVL